MRFAHEAFSENLIDEMRPLWEAHDKEIPQLGMELDPDLDVYRLMDTCGALRIYTARIGSADDNILVGYQIFFLSRHVHRRLSLEATQDVLYMAPEYRKGLAAVKFLKWCDTQLKQTGVKVIAHPIDAKHDFGMILKRMGYQLMDLVFMRRV